MNPALQSRACESRLRFGSIDEGIGQQGRAGCRHCSRHRGSTGSCARGCPVTREPALDERSGRRDQSSGSVGRGQPGSRTGGSRGRCRRPADVRVGRDRWSRAGQRRAASPAGSDTRAAQPIRSLIAAERPGGPRGHSRPAGRTGSTPGKYSRPRACRRRAAGPSCRSSARPRTAGTTPGTRSRLNRRTMPVPHARSPPRDGVTAIRGGDDRTRSDTIGGPASERGPAEAGLPRPVHRPGRFGDSPCHPCTDGSPAGCGFASTCERFRVGLEVRRRRAPEQPAPAGRHRSLPAALSRAVRAAGRLPRRRSPWRSRP